jgi:hypothetical protein
MKPVNALCEQNAELVKIKEGGIYSYQRSLEE